VCLLRGTDWVFVCNSTFCPHGVFMSFVWIWEQTAIISLYSNNWLLLITEMDCVYCAVRVVPLNIVQNPQTVPRVRPAVIAESHFRTQVRLCEIHAGKSNSGTGFYPSTRSSLVSVIPPMFHKHLHPHSDITRRARVHNGVNHPRNNTFFRKSGKAGD